VTRVAEFNIQNMAARLVEKYLHDVFADCQLQLESDTIDGRTVDSKEWYVVEFERIKDEINKLGTLLQS